MTEIAFYHLTSSTLKQTLPSLLEKSLSGGKRVVIRFKEQKHLQEVNDMLWSFSTKRIIPHGTYEDPRPEKQPVYLTLGKENPSGAKVLVLPDGVQAESLERFEKVLDIFDGNDPEALEQARRRWAGYKAANTNLLYWKQDDAGKWEKQTA